ncbi:unnamed protein product [Urochloa decumbens]|uniref:Uncharacterized protein n=1 Tax=Urochloa decumbens TaxID=240449 RepID=A0ABC8ZG92_9POAL
MDDGSSTPASYIRLVHHLIEKCICYNMNKEECMETLEKHANIMPVITSTGMPAACACSSLIRSPSDTFDADISIAILPRRLMGIREYNWSPEIVLTVDFFFSLLVWKELEKENREFFETYKKDRGEDSTQTKNPPDVQVSASKSSEPQTTAASM